MKSGAHSGNRDAFCWAVKDFVAINELVLEQPS